jgi:hypothetical protein
MKARAALEISLIPNFRRIAIPIGARRAVAAIPFIGGADAVPGVDRGMAVQATRNAPSADVPDNPDFIF